MKEISPRKGATPTPAKTRMSALRARKRKAGMTPMEVWAHPDDHQAIREYAATLAKTRDQAANALGNRLTDTGAAKEGEEC